MLRHSWRASAARGTRRMRRRDHCGRSGRVKSAFVARRGLIKVETDISPLHHLPSTIQHSPSSFPPSCPSAPALPYPALRPSLPSYPALPPPSPPGGLGFLRELLIGAKSTKMGGVRRDFRDTFCLQACFILKNPYQNLKKGSQERGESHSVFAFGTSF